MTSPLFKFLNPFQGHLPFVIVGAVAWAATGLLFASNVKSQIFNPVVCFHAIHVVNTFSRGERSAQVLRHDKAMFENASSACLHGAKQWQVLWRDEGRSKNDVPVDIQRSASAVLSLLPLKHTGTRASLAAFLTLTREVGPQKLSPERGKGIPPLSSTVRACDFGAHRGMPIHLPHLEARVYRWMHSRNVEPSGIGHVVT